MTSPLLTVTASNRDRLQIGTDATNLFISSIQWQTFQNFELLIADGGSKNFDQIKYFFDNHKGPIRMRIIKHEIGDTFLRALLNNVGIRNANGQYVMTTDVDMAYGKDFIQTLMNAASENVLVESRTMYLKRGLLKKIYSGELNPYNDLDSIKKGRIHKRSTAGGCQCMIANKENKGWRLVNGFDENGYIGWGSEDRDLFLRCKYAGMKIKWMGESKENIMLFHQEHSKPNIKKDLEHQENNKKTLCRLQKERYFKVNPNGWGGKEDK